MDGSESAESATRVRMSSRSACSAESGLQGENRVNDMKIIVDVLFMGT